MMMSSWCGAPAPAQPPLAGAGGGGRAAAPHRRPAPLFSPDGSRIAFLSAAWSDRGSIGGDLWLIPAAGGEAHDITAGYRGSVTWMEWESDDSLLLMAYEGYETIIAACTPGRPLRYCARGEFACGPRPWPRFSRAGSRLAMVREDTGQPVDIWSANPGRGEALWRRLTDLNPQVASLELGQTEPFRWRSFDG